MNIKKSYLFALFVLLIVVSLSTVVLLDGCNKHPGQQSYTLTNDTIADGKNLMQIHCTPCHALVPVNALTKVVWVKGEMPRMAHYFGITAYLDGYFVQPTDTPKISMQAWQRMVDYCKKAAPDTLLPAKPSVQPVNDWAGFAVKTPQRADEFAYTSLVAFNPYNHKIYTADGQSGSLFEWNSNLKGNKITQLPSAGVNVSFVKDGAEGSKGIFSCIGELLPIDFLNGKLMGVDLNGKNINQTTIASEMNRPVQTVTGDFNKDGLTDIVLCNQGYAKGGIDLMLQNKDHTYSSKQVIQRTGAVQAVAGDFDKDGWTDLMVLFGSSDEGLCLYTNDHHGGFKPRNLLSFPPVYGSTSFQLADIDHDGNPDLIYTCGYNFRNSRILKPYHGLYIYKNTGDWNFKQQWFYPINGCTKAIAADFDADGDLDIITSAFFADLKNNPAEGCIYFEQDKSFSFRPHTIPVSKYGHWFTMAVADYNSDGRPDILLGNYAEGFSFQGIPAVSWDKKLPFIVLENQFKK